MIRIFLMRMLTAYILCLPFIAVASPIASASGATHINNHEERKKVDPYESFNREVYKFNSGLDIMILKPVSDTYRVLVPGWGRERIRNFLSNLLAPVIFINSLLQAHPQNALEVFWQFTLNTTFGLGGMFDFAGMTGLKPAEADFGQTLGYYGMGAGPYIVLPLLGPSSLRDTVGRGADLGLDPLNYVLPFQKSVLRNGVDIVSLRADREGMLQELDRMSLDPYATLRSLYLQHRVHVIQKSHTIK